MINTKRQAPVSTSTLPVLMDEIANPNSDARSVARIIAADHGLVARVLGLANSAQFGMARRVAELDVAVGLIGSSMVQTLALASAAAVLDRKSPIARTSEHALEVAAAARIIAEMVPGARPSDAFAGGLLHDIGELLLYQAKPTEYGAMYPDFTSHAEQLATENFTFGTDHALLGAEHLLDWRVPDVIADAVADHHDPYRDSDPVTLVVAAADELVEADPHRRKTLDLLGIDPDNAHGLRDRIAEDTASLVAILF